jgi:hypothetical protein
VVATADVNDLGELDVHFTALADGNGARTPFGALSYEESGRAQM